MGIPTWYTDRITSHQKGQAKVAECEEKISKLESEIEDLKKQISRIMTEAPSLKKDGDKLISYLPILIGYTSVRTRSSGDDSISWVTTDYVYYLADLGTVERDYKLGEKSEKNMRPNTIDVSELEQFQDKARQEIIAKIDETIQKLFSTPGIIINSWDDLRNQLIAHYYLSK